MKTIALSCLLMLAPFAPAEEPACDELKSLKGTWQLEQRTVNGKTFAAEAITGVTLTIDEKGNWKVHVKDNEVLHGTFSIVGNATPKAADLTITAAGEKQGKKGQGIYELNGDTFKLCYAPPDGERPTKFESREGSLLTYSTFKRIKK